MPAFINALLLSLSYWVAMYAATFSTSLKATLFQVLHSLTYIQWLCRLVCGQTWRIDNYTGRFLCSGGQCHWVILNEHFSILNAWWRLAVIICCIIPFLEHKCADYVAEIVLSWSWCSIHPKYDWKIYSGSNTCPPATYTSGSYTYYSSHCVVSS